jgi:hypothetical protein
MHNWKFKSIRQNDSKMQRYQLQHFINFLRFICKKYFKKLHRGRNGLAPFKSFKWMDGANEQDLPHSLE